MKLVKLLLRRQAVIELTLAHEESQAHLATRCLLLKRPIRLIHGGVDQLTVLILHVLHTCMQIVQNLHDSRKLSRVIIEFFE